MNGTYRILSFKLFGKFAHFRKFYTNASSLSYLIPPRTVITGMLASILTYPRDEYYEDFSPGVCRISVAVSPEGDIKKINQSVNLLHDKYYNYLCKGSEKPFSGGSHAQCKMELLASSPGKHIEYQVYVAMEPANPLIKKLEEKLQAGRTGYGVYFGQRAFRAGVEFSGAYGPDETVPMEESDVLDSLCAKENLMEFSTQHSLDIMMEEVPVHMRKVEKKGTTGREPVMVKQVVFERRGRRLHGRFKDCLQVGGRVISFY